MQICDIFFHLETLLRIIAGEHMDEIYIGWHFLGTKGYEMIWLYEYFDKNRSIDHKKHNEALIQKRRKYTLTVLNNNGRTTFGRTFHTIICYILDV